MKRATGVFVGGMVFAFLTADSAYAQEQVRDSREAFLNWEKGREVIEKLPLAEQQLLVDFAYQQSPELRIISGTPVNKAQFDTQFPWMVALGVRLSTGETQFCGGSLISRNWVLTAAHCDAFPNPAFFVSVRHSHPFFTQAERVGIRRFVRHPSYVAANSGFDVALIELANPVSFDARVTLADALPPVGTNSEIIGWGKLAANASNGTDQLQHGRVLTVTLDTCKQNYASAPFLVTNWETMTCAAKTGVDSCQGDSGGPMLSGTGNGAMQFGIVSFGEGCADPAYPGIYASVPALRQWIRSVSGL